MLLLLFVAVVVFAVVAIKVKSGGKETPEDRELKSRVGAALGNALPPAFGGQSSSFLPTPDTSDRFEPESTHVAQFEPREPPESDHPFRRSALPRNRFDMDSVPDVLPKPKPKKKRKRVRPVEPPFKPS